MGEQGGGEQVAGWRPAAAASYWPPPCLGVANSAHLGRGRIVTKSRQRQRLLTRYRRFLESAVVSALHESQNNRQNGGVVTQPTRRKELASRGAGAGLPELAESRGPCPADLQRLIRDTRHQGFAEGEAPAGGSKEKRTRAQEDRGDKKLGSKLAGAGSPAVAHRGLALAPRPSREQPRRTSTPVPPLTPSRPLSRPPSRPPARSSMNMESPPPRTRALRSRPPPTHSSQAEPLPHGEPGRYTDQLRGHGRRLTRAQRSRRQCRLLKEARGPYGRRKGSAARRRPRTTRLRRRGPD